MTRRTSCAVSTVVALVLAALVRPPAAGVTVQAIVCEYGAGEPMCVTGGGEAPKTPPPPVPRR